MSSTERYEQAASAQISERLQQHLRGRNIEALIVEDADGARGAVLERIPEGAEVHSGKSKTLEDAGILDALQEPNRFEYLRPRLLSMDRATQAREMRKLVASPDVMLGSAQAITEDGVMVVASATGSQIGPIAAGAGRVILVIGSQKIVSSAEAALDRIRTYVFDWEQARVRETMGVDTVLAKTLIIEREWLAGRTTVVLVREPIGV
jgi:hypothetical protein